MSSKAQEWLRPAGWAVYSTLWAPSNPEGFGPVFNTPMATVLTKGKAMTIFIRGTQSIIDMWIGKQPLQQLLVAVPDSQYP
jgi:hypothetical protein